MVAESGSVAGAAKRLHLAQPALTRQMQQLEEHVGARLIERERRGIRLTASGEALLAGARNLFARIEQAVTQAHEASDGRRGTLHIAVARIALENPLIGRAIAAARSQYPGISEQVSEIASIDQPVALRARDVDIAIGALGFGNDGAVGQEVLYEDAVDCALVAADHPIARRDSVGIEKLLDERYLTLDTFAEPYPQIIQALTHAGVQRFERFKSLESVFHLVAARRGWTMVPRSMRANPPAGCDVVPLEGFSVPVPVHVRWRATDRSQLVLNVVQVLLRETGNAQRTETRRLARSDNAVSPARQLSRAPSARTELQQLRALAAVLDEGSMSKAAARLNITQSGVSRRLHALEHEVGLRLVMRVSHGVIGTTAGYALGAELDEILRLAHDAVVSARQAAGGMVGSCTIGTLPPELTGTLLISALRRVQENCPNIALEIIELTSDHQVSALRDRRIDIGMAGGFPAMVDDPAIAAVLLMQDPLECALVSSSHPLASRAWVSASELSDEPFFFVSRYRAPRYYDTVMKAFAQIGLHPRAMSAYSGPRVAWRLAASLKGWTVASRSQRSSPPPGMVAIPVEGLNAEWGVMLLWRRDEKDAIVQQVLAAFRDGGVPRG